MAGFTKNIPFYESKIGMFFVLTKKHGLSNIKSSEWVRQIEKENVFKTG